MYGGTWRRAQVPPKAYVPWRWAVGGALLGTLATLVVFAPARWLAAGLAQATQQQVILSDPTGSIWRGSAQLVLSGGAGSHDRAGLPGRVSWRLSPGWQGLQAQVEASCCTRQPMALGVTPLWGGVQLKLAQLQADLPAQLLEGLGAPFNTLQPQGRLSLASQGLTVRWQSGRASLQGEASFTASDVSSRVSPLKPLGSYRVVISGGDSPSLALSTLGDAPLRLTGSGRWVSSRLRFSGEAVAAPEHEVQLSNLLTLIGRRSGGKAIISVG
ncbi:general secretion pathway protein GspN [Comamonas serinivorans]|uniref:Type II secretion system protein N n=1 Tax=Comamonas serinivorans TaxID=1082851 RepID=A0A1Y0ESH8_9BURK|nr:type II secretion system protein N [Comamonas serinivorans]ARU06331.1 general secretion pathway protein GspN [Comamonas serinivorans]